MAKLLKLRFLDTTDAEDHKFVTLFMDGKLRGYKKTQPKDTVTKSVEGSSCRVQKDLLLEARGVGLPWHQIKQNKFEGFLGEFNAYRTSLGWEPVELPNKENEQA